MFRAIIYNTRWTLLLLLGGVLFLGIGLHMSGNQVSVPTTVRVFFAPSTVDAYLQSTYYSQSYYQNYYQGYYQAYYQAAYAGGGGGNKLLFSTPVIITGGASVVDGISKGSGTFVIDHPLDPENKLLYHSFVESPDVKNIYDGIAVLDSNGEAVVKLPDYFEALNGADSARFLLTPLLEPAPGLYVKGSGIKDNRFSIAGGPPNVKVSWQVTGIRQDPYIKANPIIPEVEKGPDALVPKGQFLFPNYWDWVGEPGS